MTGGQISGAARATPTPWPALAGTIAIVTVYAASQGLTYPLLSFILERQGQSSLLIGLSAAMTPLGFMVCAPFVPMIARTFGAARAALFCALSAGVLLALIGWTRSIWPWFPLRFLLGTAVIPLYVLSEGWLLTLAPPERRGRIMGIYTSTISAGFAAGPLILLVVGTEGWLPFAAGVAGFLGCTGCLIVVMPMLPKAASGHASVRSFLPRAPALLLAVGTAAAYEQAVLALLPVYGVAHRLGESTVAGLLTSIIAGNIVLQVPIGLLAERLGSTTVRRACAIGAAIASALLPFLIDTYAVWPLALLLGGLFYGIYTTSITELGDRFSGSVLMAGNAAFALAWGIGGIAGPPVTGSAMALFGAEALPIALALLCLVVAGFSSRLKAAAPASPVRNR